MTERVKLLGLSGSLRRGSLNSALLRELARLSPEGVSLELADYRELPHYDDDLDKPDAVSALERRVAAADGVVIATPEYNHSIPGALKNALDWLSRPAYRSVFAGKPVAVLSVSPGAVGGARAQAHLKAVLGGMVAQLFPHPEIAIGAGHERIREGRIVADDTRELLTRYMRDFSSWVERTQLPKRSAA